MARFQCKQCIRALELLEEKNAYAKPPRSVWFVSSLGLLFQITDAFDCKTKEWKTPVSFVGAAQGPSLRVTASRQSDSRLPGNSSENGKFCGPTSCFSIIRPHLPFSLPPGPTSIHSYDTLLEMHTKVLTKDRWAVGNQTCPTLPQLSPAFFPPLQNKPLKTVWGFLRKLNIELLYDHSVPLLGIYPNEMKAYVYHKLVHRVSFGDDGNVLKLYCDAGCSTLNILKIICLL